MPSDFLASGSLDSAIRRLGGDLIGKHIGAYHVTALLGAGGMGEVYRAHDTKLGRDVAIKVLPPAFASDSDRLSRFQREARVLASLNHPNIAAIYELEDTSGVPALVLELVEGDTLAERLAKGSLPIPEALRIARQIAGALDAAHEHAIVHRDLKPANIKITSDGTVKVLDFGLARTSRPAPTASDPPAEPDRTWETREAVILGTAAYMSPEQARGRAVDKRTDIWAFGCLLFEMLGGQPAFAGATASDVIAAILERDVDWNALPGNLPVAVQRLLRRCLEKDMKHRLRDIGDAVHELDTSLSYPVSMAPDDGEHGGTLVTGDHPATGYAVRRRRVWYIAGVALVSVAVAVALMRKPSDGESARGYFATPSVVVLPFNSVGGDSFLADGITESVTRELGRIGELRVIAANSAFAYRGNQGAKDVGRELNARLLVRGSVQRAGDRMRVNASLVDTARDETLWSDRYDRLARDVLTVQDDIAWQIASKVAAAVGLGTPERPSPAVSTTPEAYEAYLRAQSHMRGRSGIVGRGKRYAAAVEEFERSVTLDNGFAPAHAGLASAYTQLFFFDATNPTFEQKALLEIERALAINSDQAEVYLARAQLVWNLRNGFPHERAIADLRRAITSNPNLADAHIELGRIYHHIGLLEKSIAANEEALRLDPLAIVAGRRQLHAFIDGGMRQRIQDVLARNPQWLAPIDRAEALLALDDVLAAQRALAEYKPAGGGDDGLLPMEPNLPFQGQVFARLKRYDEARRVLETIIPRAVNPTGLSHIHHAQFMIACTFALLGESDKAVEWLTKAANDGYPSYPKFSVEPDLASLKSHPGFIELLARLRRDFERWRVSL